MTPKELRVGERVAVYVGMRRFIDTIEEVYDNGILRLRESTVIVHRKQCRRLKPKRKPRTVWIREQDLPPRFESRRIAVSAGEMEGDDFVEFREVAPKKERK